MSTLKSLTFTTLPNLGANSTLDRRSKVIARLEEQKKLLADPKFTRTVRTSALQDGEKTVVEKQQRILPWWRTLPDGSYALFVRSGVTPIEFEKGKTAISVSSLDKMAGVIDTLIAAVRVGELDEQLAHASKQATTKKTKKAA